MAAYVFSKNGLQIYDTTGAVVPLNSAGQNFDHIENVITITTSDGLSNYGASPPIAFPQPSTPVQVYALI